MYIVYSEGLEKSVYAIGRKFYECRINLHLTRSCSNITNTFLLLNRNHFSVYTLEKALQWKENIDVNNY